MKHVPKSTSIKITEIFLDILCGITFDLLTVGPLENDININDIIDLIQDFRDSYLYIGILRFVDPDLWTKPDL